MRREWMWASLAFLLVGCSEPGPAVERCADEEYAMFAQVSLDTGSGSLSYDAIAEAGDGQVDSDSVILHFTGFDDGSGAKPLILRIEDNGTGRGLLDKLSADLEGGPVTKTLLDISDVGVGSMNLTGLADFGCSYVDGTLCVQLGVDEDGDRLVTDSDEFVFNATGGTVTFTQASAAADAIEMTFDVQLSSNILADGSSAPGSVAGCVLSGLSASGSGGWSID